MISHEYRGRIAPTTSGFLHAGHLATFRTAAERAKKAGGKLVLRIEDLDRARCTDEYERACLEDLNKARIAWDEGPDVGGAFAPYRQSQRTASYARALEKLARAGAVYPCGVSRRTLLAAGLEQKRKFDFSPPEKIFPPALRAQTPAWDGLENPLGMCWRFRTPDLRTVRFDDALKGECRFTALEDFGDFVVWRRDGIPAYELAAVADDIAMRITEVVRGEDLLLSTARQILVYEALNAEIPQFAHCPLLRDEHGEKISKTTLKNRGYRGKLLIRDMESC